MNINTKSWHYKVYSLSYLTEYPPVQTNLCQYCRRLIFVAPLVAIVAVAMLAAYIIAFVFKSVTMLPFGYCPNSWDIAEETKYTGLKIGKLSLLPWHVMLPVFIVWLEYLFIHHFGWMVPLVVQGAIILTLGVIAFIVVIPDNETFRLFTVWISAKKQRICPVVKFDHKPTSEE